MHLTPRDSLHVRTGVHDVILKHHLGLVCIKIFILFLNRTPIKSLFKNPHVRENKASGVFDVAADYESHAVLNFSSPDHEGNVSSSG